MSCKCKDWGGSSQYVEAADQHLALQWEASLEIKDPHAILRALPRGSKSTAAVLSVARQSAQV